MRLSEARSLAHRSAHAALIGALNIITWVVIPQYLFSSLSEAAPNVPLTGGLIIAAGASITALQVLGALTEGGALSAIFNAGSYIASAYYLYAATGGGVINVSASGITVELTFQTLLMLMMLPSLFNVLRAGISYLLEENEGARLSGDQVTA